MTFKDIFNYGYTGFDVIISLITRIFPRHDYKNTLKGK